MLAAAPFALLLGGSPVWAAPNAQTPAASATTSAAPAADPRAEALWAAARKGDARAVREQLDAGADVNAKFRYDATALSYACDRGHVDVVRVLLERGATVNVKDTFYGATPLDWAIQPAQGRTTRHDDIVRLLVERGAAGLERAAFQAAAAGQTIALGIVMDRLSPSPDLLSDLHDWAVQREQPDVAAQLRSRGAVAGPDEAPAVEAAVLQRFAGRYTSPAGTEYVVALADGKLTASGPDGRPATLVPVVPPHFRLNGMAATRVVFVAGEQGDVTGVRVSQFGETTAFTRVGGKP
jgi:hypothetical protein